MLRNYIEYMDYVIAGKSILKWYMLSAHDTNLA